jgi:hypothetical protein
MARQLGETIPLGGDVTTLQWIKPGYEAETCLSLGYRIDRLSSGYQIGFLRQMPRPDDFIFAGTSLRSGGRLGLPKRDQDNDKQRRHVHDEMVKERGAEAVRQMQRAALSMISLHGAQRLVKILPVILHDPFMSPAEQYPMGGGGLQWTLVRPLDFLIAVQVFPDGTVRTTDFTLNLKQGGYDTRAILRSYMEKVG